MRDLRTQEQITANWKGDFDKPVVSICCITYNHEPYIEDALEGFLMQETNFPFEILIHDDASTDRTADIIREYEVKYPKLIKPIYQIENQYSQRKLVFMIVSAKAKGKFIAFCEGDDYWTDSNKLQIQTDYLLEHPEVVISGHDAFIIDDNGDRIKDSKLPNEHKRDYESEELILGRAWILTMSWMLRNIAQDNIPELSMIKNGDNFFVSLIGHHGGSHYHHDIKPAAYRVHIGGIWSMLSEVDKRDSQLNTWFWIYRYYHRVGEAKYAHHYWMKYLRALLLRASLKDLAQEFFIRALFFREQKALL